MAIKLPKTFQKNPMKKYNILFLLISNIVITAFPMQAQNDYQSSKNKLYWKNKRHQTALINDTYSYFQQDVHYIIKADVNEKTNVVRATEQLIYTNNAPQDFDVVYFNLYQNAFTKGSYLEALHEANQQPITRMGMYEANGLGTVVKNVKANGKICKLEMDNTILKVYLPQPLRQGESITFSMDFMTYFDRGSFRRRMTTYNSFGAKHFNGVHWYPRICVYDQQRGWNIDQHLNKELYGDYGLFDVELTFANNYVVEATGALQNPSEVYPGDLRQRLDAKNFANKTWNEAPSIITPYDSTQRKKWHFVANNVHDFAFTADPHYRICESNWNGIQCIGLVLEPHASRWQNSGDYIAKIIKTFSTDFGMYEYPKIIAADANDGMEYPMLTLCGGADPDYRGLFTHEIAHNWFYGMIGNNETYRAALDEGFTQFLTAWGLQKIDGDTMQTSPIKNKFVRRNKEVNLVLDRNVYNRYMFDAVRADDKMLNTHSNDFHGALGHENGYSNVYHKTATMLYNLKYVLGEEAFLKGMQNYVNKWKIAHPYFEDFRQAITETTQTDLSWFFDQWLETTKSIDYGIKSIKKTHIPNQYKIKFKRYGKMQMPIEFQVKDKKNQVANYLIPNTEWVKKTNATRLPKWYGWDILNPTFTAKIDVPQGLKSVQLDPSNSIADVNPLNNSKRMSCIFPKESYSFKLDKFISNGPSWKKYQAFIRPDIWWNNVDGIKTGIHVDGSYMNYANKFYGTIWLNTRLLSQLEYRSFEGESWWKGISPIDYTLRYETPLKKINHKISAGFETRMLEGFAKHGINASYQLSTRDKFKAEVISLYRYGRDNRNYLFSPNEWNSFLQTPNATKANIFLQLNYQHQYAGNGKRGLITTTVRTPFTYDYSYAQAEWIHRFAWKKFEIHSRLFARQGFGKNIPTESALYLQGANPEELMENKFTRSQGIVPLSMGGYTTDNFSNLHAGGGMNLRGYTGYYAIDQNNQNEVFINYKGRSGAAINLELEFDRWINFRPKYIRDYLHLDMYIFSDAGIISRSPLDVTNIPSLNPLSESSKLRADAGLGAALTIKKFGFFDKIPPFVIRVDLPWWISSSPYSRPDNIDFSRWIIGVSRAF